MVSGSYEKFYHAHLWELREDGNIQTNGADAGALHNDNVVVTVFHFVIFFVKIQNANFSSTLLIGLGFHFMSFFIFHIENKGEGVKILYDAKVTDGVTYD